MLPQRVPTVAIHLSRTKPETGFKFNPETNMGPVLVRPRGPAPKPAE